LGVGVEFEALGEVVMGDGHSVGHKVQQKRGSCSSTPNRRSFPPRRKQSAIAGYKNQAGFQQEAFPQ
jgi:hypothetical protein